MQHKHEFPYLAAVAQLALFGSARPALAQDKPRPIVEFVTGYAGFVDENWIDRTMIGGDGRFFVSRRVAIGPEFVLLKGANSEHDLTLTGNVTIDLLPEEATAPRRVIPYIAAGGGYLRQTTQVGTGAVHIERRYRLRRHRRAPRARPRVLHRAGTEIRVRAGNQNRRDHWIPARYEVASPIVRGHRPPTHDPTGDRPNDQTGDQNRGVRLRDDGVRQAREDPTTRPAGMGGRGSLTVAAKKPSANLEQNAPSKAARLSGKLSGNINSTSTTPIARPNNVPNVTRDMRSLRWCIAHRQRLVLQDLADDFALFLDETANALVGQREQRVERRAIERLGLGGALHFDEAAVGGLDDVHVHFGARVFVVREVEQRRAVDDADARRGDVVGDRARAGCAPCSRSRSSASTSATNPPVIDAVRVPPSAWMTSQSIQTVRSPSSAQST